MPPTDGPHQGQPVLDDGSSLEDAGAVLILLHGRGASAQGMLRLAERLQRSDVACLAPQAARRSWYPDAFIAPLAENEPELRSALAVVRDLLARVEAAGLGPHRTVLMGFSQGACLATTYAARHPLRYGGVVGLSGGLIGPEDVAFAYDGSLDGTPVFLGCSDRDPYIPVERVRQTAETFRQLDADVTTQIYEGLGHETNEDEIRHVRLLLNDLVASDET